MNVLRNYDQLSPAFRTTFLNLVLLLTEFQIAASHALLFLYKISPFGNVPGEILTSGWLRYYYVAMPHWLR
jgi:hypothetical protein